MQTTRTKTTATELRDAVEEKVGKLSLHVRSAFLTACMKYLYYSRKVETKDHLLQLRLNREPLWRDCSLVIVPWRDPNSNLNLETLPGIRADSFAKVIERLVNY